MLLVLATQQDPVARQLVDRWRTTGVDCALMHCMDLATKGWQLSLGGRQEAGIHGRIGEQVVDRATLKGVVTRLWAVSATEIPFLHDEDRLYAAAEMHAFLLGWLSALPCPVLNAPSAGCLSGPTLSHEQWVTIAAAQRVRIRTVLRKIQFSADGSTPLEPMGLAAETSPTLEVSVVGSKCFGAPDDAYAKAAAKIARAAGVEILRVVFARDGRTTPLFVHADYWVNVADPQIADAIRERCSS